MPVQVITATGYIAAAVLAGLALYQWRRASSLYALLVEGANRYDELRQRAVSVEQTLQKEGDKAKAQTETHKRLTAALEQSRDKTAELVAKLEQQSHEHQQMIAKLEQQKGHLQQHVAIAQSSQAQAVAQLAEAQQQVELAKAQSQRERQTQHEDRGAWERERQLIVQDWQARLKTAEDLQQTTVAQAKSADPLELRRLKRKVAQYDRLYSSMKGLREMSDERNRNWEVALGRLAAWILEEKGVAQVPKAIGPLVGQALQMIGAQLIDDELMPPREGGELAAHMDAERELGELEASKGLDAPR